jgi:hypothetical protein
MGLRMRIWRLCGMLGALGLAAIAHWVAIDRHAMPEPGITSIGLQSSHRRLAEDRKAPIESVPSPPRPPIGWTTSEWKTAWEKLDSTTREEVLAEAHRIVATVVMPWEKENCIRPTESPQIGRNRSVIVPPIPPTLRESARQRFIETVKPMLAQANAALAINRALGYLDYLIGDQNETVMIARQIDGDGELHTTLQRFHNATVKKQADSGLVTISTEGRVTSGKEWSSLDRPRYADLLDQ